MLEGSNRGATNTQAAFRVLVPCLGNSVNRLDLWLTLIQSWTGSQSARLVFWFR